MSRAFFASSSRHAPPVAACPLLHLLPPRLPAGLPFAATSRLPPLPCALTTGLPLVMEGQVGAPALCRPPAPPPAAPPCQLRVARLVKSLNYLFADEVRVGRWWQCTPACVQPVSNLSSMAGKTAGVQRKREDAARKRPQRQHNEACVNRVENRGVSGSKCWWRIAVSTGVQLHCAAPFR